MKLTGMKGGEVYISASDVVVVCNATGSPYATVAVREHGEWCVRESVAGVTAAMEAERAAIVAESPTRLALRAVAAGLEAAATQVRGDDPSPALRTVARMLFSAAAELGAHGAASVRP